MVTSVNGFGMFCFMLSISLLYYLQSGSMAKHWTNSICHQPSLWQVRTNMWDILDKVCSLCRPSHSLVFDCLNTSGQIRMVGSKQAWEWSYNVPTYVQRKVGAKLQSTSMLRARCQISRWLNADSSRWKWDPVHVCNIVWCYIIWCNKQHIITVFVSSTTAPHNAYKFVLQVVEWLTASLSGLATHELTTYSLVQT